MNKILVAFILSVVMSGNAYASRALNIYCDKLNEGYTFNKTVSPDVSITFFHEPSDKIKTLFYIQAIWSPDYVSWNANGYWRINRKTIELEYKKNIEETYYVYNQCSLVDASYKIDELIYKKRAEKTKGNKF